MKGDTAAKSRVKGEVQDLEDKGYIPNQLQAVHDLG